MEVGDRAAERESSVQTAQLPGWEEGGGAGGVAAGGPAARCRRPSASHGLLGAREPHVSCLESE